MPVISACSPVALPLAGAQVERAEIAQQAQRQDRTAARNTTAGSRAAA
jgi:hypothetical protein